MLFLALAAALIKPDMFQEGEQKIQALANRIHHDANKAIDAAKNGPTFKGFDAKFEQDTTDDLPASFLQTKDAPSDDGFSKVEAKLKALEEKMKADAAKFEAEAKAPASSLIQTKDAPSDDGFSKVEAKLKALEEKMKADAAKFEAEAKAPASSLIQTKDAPSDDGFSKVEAKLKALEEKMKADAAKFEAEAKAPPSSLAEVAARSAGRWARGMSLAQEFHHQTVQKVLDHLNQDCITHRCSKYTAEALKTDDFTKRVNCAWKRDHEDGIVGRHHHPSNRNIDSCFEGVKWSDVSPTVAQLMNCASEKRCVSGRIDSLLEKGFAKTKSSFLQTKDAPSDDGFSKVEAKLKALEEKMKADAAKFEAEAKAPASSFIEVGADGNLRSAK